MAQHTRGETARVAARRGGSVALESFREKISFETKANKTDVVSAVDREAQRTVVETIRERFPDDAVIAEEDDATTTIPDSGAAWIIDPIDGTSNYLRGLRSWATSVAAVVDGTPVAAVSVFPALEDIYRVGPDGAFGNGQPLSVSDRTDPETLVVAPMLWWDHDRRDEYAAAADAIVKRFGDLIRLRCAQLTLAQVAAGGIDAALTNVDSNPWDTVAGAFAIERAGGTVTDLDGDPWTHASTGLVASNGECHQRVLEAARHITANR
jgi:myo-inositol-1(or 4)-monophosphatase